MSANCKYNPVPPRAWSRVQNPCTYLPPALPDTYSVFVPSMNQTMTLAEANVWTQQWSKGNVLQYKANSARQTKRQKYSQLAQGFGPNRTKVYATQSDTYSNPNTRHLARVGATTYPYPNIIVGAPNNPSGPFQYNVPNPDQCNSTNVVDGGTLLCGTVANPCSEEIVQPASTNPVICNPSSASDVPGFSVLCWNKRLQPWFPKPRYFMNNSTDKWPTNYKGFKSAYASST